ncbi:hypothetical protein HanPI659440_Chr06g0234241 [Helianthus annuus]|nr:hypothetical protein HanPI659440_Chr06g0234241 [Helianthus annuus]
MQIACSPLMSTRSTGIFLDEYDSYRTPFRWGAIPLTGQSSGQWTGEALSTTTTTRIRNTQGGRVRRGRGGPLWAHGMLPSSYPRIPLRDITHVVQAVERRRARMGDGEGRIRTNEAAAGEQEVCLPTPKPKFSSAKKAEREKKVKTLMSTSKALISFKNFQTFDFYIEELHLICIFLLYCQ